MNEVRMNDRKRENDSEMQIVIASSSYRARELTRAGQVQKRGKD